MSDDKTDENFAIQLTSQTQNHDEWLAVVRYGLNTLLEDPPLLIEIVVREAQRQLELGGDEGRVVAQQARTIFQELRLRISKP